MKMRVRSVVVGAVAMSVLAGAAVAQAPATNMMTYQGKLDSGGQPFSGTIDITVRQYNAALGGSAIGLSNCWDNLPVVDGLFTLTFHPGSVLDGRALWLEFDVREDSATGNACAGTFTTLSPRTALTAAPLASALVLPASEIATVPGAAFSITNTANSTSTVAVQGVATAASGDSVAVQGANFSTGTNAVGILGRIGSPTPGAGAVGVFGTVSASGTTNGIGVYGYHTSQGMGVRGDSNGGIGVAGVGNVGVDGLAAGTGTNPVGVYGKSFGPTGTGVKGEHNAATGTAPGVYGHTNSTDAGAVGVVGYVVPGAPGVNSAGVLGQNQGTGTNGSGVRGIHFGSGSGVEGVGFSGTGVHGEGTVAGVRGEALSSATASYGVYGLNPNPTGIGTRGEHTAVTGANPGVLGTTFSASTDASGVWGRVDSATPGVNSAGVLGTNFGTASDSAGVRGEHSGTGVGVFGVADNSVGVFGIGGLKGVRGTTALDADTSAVGVEGTCGAGTGVYGLHIDTTGTRPGVLGATLSTAADAVGVLGEVRPTAPGAFSAGVKGHNLGTGGSGVGVYGRQNGSGYGVYGEVGNAAGYAGFFSGRVHVSGALTKGSGAFKIDHPLDPENKFLYHSFVESPDMMNIYNGVATTDERGYATVTMPEWFEALNQDFRYQLTVIDDADSDDFVLTKVVKGIADNRFTLRASRGGVKVSWQVTGIRHDVFAREQRIPNEEMKSEGERGMFLYPQGFGFGEERRIGNVKVETDGGQ